MSAPRSEEVAVQTSPRHPCSYHPLFENLSPTRNRRPRPFMGVSVPNSRRVVIAWQLDLGVHSKYKHAGEIHAVASEGGCVFVFVADLLVSDSPCCASPLKRNRCGEMFGLYRRSFSDPESWYRSTKRNFLFCRCLSTETGLLKAAPACIRSRCSPPSASLGTRTILL
jgi:hypothetical protein